jgi:DNA invertase Pin-like site-specific DNA recombinase
VILFKNVLRLAYQPLEPEVGWVGRPKGLPKKAEATACATETLYKEGVLTVDEISKKLGIAKSTLYSYLRHRGVTLGAYNTHTQLCIVKQISEEVLIRLRNHLNGLFRIYYLN